MKIFTDNSCDDMIVSDRRREKVSFISGVAGVLGTLQAAAAGSIDSNDLIVDADSGDSLNGMHVRETAHPLDEDTKKVEGTSRITSIYVLLLWVLNILILFLPILEVYLDNLNKDVYAIFKAEDLDIEKLLSKEELNELRENNFSNCNIKLIEWTWMDHEERKRSQSKTREILLLTESNNTQRTAYHAWSVLPSRCLSPSAPLGGKKVMPSSMMRHCM
eukprot:GHVH01016635.1.p1 GENE.GHVH01016635.1~~GHVH01016635.1.p1  ORF type:complete len:218 (+),score=35.69 GHVH01016635.1:45-698(+)